MSIYARARRSVTCAILLISNPDSRCIIFQTSFLYNYCSAMVVKVCLDTILTIYMCGARIIDAN